MSKLITTGITPDYDAEGQLLGHSMKFEWDGPPLELQLGIVMNEPFSYVRAEKDKE